MFQGCSKDRVRTLIYLPPCRMSHLEKVYVEQQASLVPLLLLCSVVVLGRAPAQPVHSPSAAAGWPAGARWNRQGPGRLRPGFGLPHGDARP